MSIFNKMADINYVRGDTTPITVVVKENGAVKDITGSSFEFVVNTNKNPVDASDEVFRITGVITDATNGAVEFRTSATTSTVAPATYYYDIQQVDGAGYKRTLLKSTFVLEQDINKS